MSSSAFQPIQGMSDLASPDIHLWQELETRARAVLDRYDFEEIRTPVLERSEVFLRSLGDTTDVVQKEMYTFTDRGGRHLALRPEGTAGVMRHLAARGPEAHEARLFYWGPMFRSERPQAGRRRQFHQLGVEAMGPPNPAADAEVLALQLHILSDFGLDKCEVKLNTRGMPQDRAPVADALREAIQPRLSELGEDDQRRFEENVLRLLDSKDPACRDIISGLPPVTTFMCDESRQYLEAVRAVLADLNIEAEVSPTLVRGLDYYVHTVWEVTHPALGAQDALSGGGRYEITLGRKTLEGVGFALGLERVIAAVEAERGAGALARKRDLVWFVSVGDAAFRENLMLAQTLRRRGVACRLDLSQRSMKAQMRAANRAGASVVVIRGDQEIADGTFQYKNMADGTQEQLEMAELVQRLTATQIHTL